MDKNDTSSLSLTPPPLLNTVLRLPASKSISNRALILSALTGGTTLPAGLADCDDTRVLRSALRDLPPVIDIHGAGTAMRFLTAYLCTLPGTHTLTGSARMQQRPIGILVDALRQTGAQIAYAGQEGFPPLRITGTALHGGDIALPGNVSSQYISALLLIAPALPGGLRLKLRGRIASRPYIDLTLQLLRDYGAQARWTASDELEVAEGGLHDTPFEVEADWSAASYWYEAVALGGGCVRLQGLRLPSAQGDCRGAELFADLGVETCPDPATGDVCLTRKATPKPHLEADMADIPDLAQTVVVTCCLLGATFRLSGLHSLRIKETDRIAALCTELGKLGYALRPGQDDGTLTWDGTRQEAQAAPLIATYDDHRMALAFAPACLRLGRVRIAHPEVVDKSYPGYWEDLRRAGFGLSRD